MFKIIKYSEDLTNYSNQEKQKRIKHKLNDIVTDYKSLKYAVGSEFENSNGCKFRIIGKSQSGQGYFYIKFGNGYIRKSHYNSIRENSAKNPFYPNWYNKGFMGVGPYNSKHRSYRTWASLLSRCYAPEEKREKWTYSTYYNCEVSYEWLNFQNFAEWYDANYVEGWQLDKDILKRGNKLYCPEFCTFVPHQINSTFTKANSIRGDFPIGVYYHKRDKVYRSEININDKVIRLGNFKSPDEAFFVYKEAKENHIKDLADQYKDKLDKNVYNALINYEVRMDD